jgi:putative DNA primase/helicase
MNKSQAAKPLDASGDLARTGASESSTVSKTLPKGIGDGGVERRLVPRKNEEANAALSGGLASWERVLAAAARGNRGTLPDIFKNALTEMFGAAKKIKVEDTEISDWAVRMGELHNIANQDELQAIIDDALAVVNSASATPQKAQTDNGDKTDGEFTMNPESGLFVEITKGTKTETKWIAAPFEIVGRVRDPNSEGWARRLRWTDDDRQVHEHTVSDADLHTEVGALCARLASLGLKITTGPARAHLIRYLNDVTVDARVTRFPSTGWHSVGSKSIFVLPGCHQDGELTVIVEGAGVSPYEKSGSLLDWQTSVGKLIAGHKRLMFATATAFAPPLLKLVDGEGGGFNFRGSSSIGKTTALRASASVWGRADEYGIMRTWRGTANGIEGTAVLFSDTLLALDELGVASAQEVGNIVYSLASGIGKQRAQQDGSLRRSKSWRVIVFSTGEISIADKIREAGKAVRGGQEIRILDIDADAGKGFGVFDHGGPDGDASKLAIAIKDATVKFYGIAGPAFVKALSSEGLDKIAADIQVAHAALTERLTGNAANGQVSRAARRFALTGVAGELAVQLGILPLSPGQVATATEELFATWRGNRGDDPSEITAAIEQIRTLLERFGDSRFDPLSGEEGARPVSDRLGWVRGTGSERQWLIPAGVWRETFCKGFDARMVARALADRGMLLPDGQGKCSRSERVAGKPTRVYVVTAVVLTDHNQEAH